MPACSGRPQSCNTYAIGTLIAGALFALPATAQNAEPRAWSSDVKPALLAYYADDFVATQQQCRVLLRSRTAPHIAQDAALLHALALTSTPARDACIEGRGRLAQLVSIDPSLVDEPECDLALGRAALQLNETARALSDLDRAARGFAAQELPARELVALALLAEVWSLHAEWDQTPPQFEVERPLSTDEAHRVRFAQVEAVLDRIRRLPEHETALLRASCALANLLAGTSRTREAVATLEPLLRAERTRGPRAEAALLLSEFYQDLGETQAALHLLDRIERDAGGAVAREATRLREQWTRPQLALTTTRSPECSATKINLTARGYAQVVLEVRQVDPEPWLRMPGQRGIDAHLPITGSVRAAWTLDTRTPDPLGMWASEQLSEPLTFTAEPGAYVVVARANAPDGNVEARKHLVTVSSLNVVCATGTEHGVLWVTRRANGERCKPLRAPVTGEFWMRHSFVATALQFNGGVAHFRLPAESRVTRSLEWICVVRCNDEIAICRGALPDAARAAPRAAPVALLCGPPEPRVGETLWISGHTTPPVNGTPAADRAEYEITLTDALDQPAGVIPIALDAVGAFTVELPIDESFSGKHVRATLRRDGQVAPNRLQNCVFSVPPVEDARFEVHLAQPTHLLPGDRLRGAVQVTYPWGTPPHLTRVFHRLHVVALPDETSPIPPEAINRTFRTSRVDPRGRTSIWITADELSKTSRPQAVFAEAEAVSWEDRRGGTTAELLVGPEPVHAWLLHEPSEVRTHLPVRFRVGWFQPGGRAVAVMPPIEIRRADDVIERLELVPSPQGLQTLPWYPPEPGRYVASVVVPDLEGAPLVVTRALTVLSPPTGEAATPIARCKATLTPRSEIPGVAVSASGLSDDPALVLVIDDDVVAAAELVARDDQSDAIIAFDDALSADAHVRILDLRDGCLRDACAPASIRDRYAADELKLIPPGGDTWPGTRVRIGVESTTAEVGLLTARLIPAADTGFAAPVGTSPEAGAVSAPVGTTSLSFAANADIAVDMQTAPDRSRGASSASHEGTTLWTTATAFVPPGHIDVEVPGIPALYKLLVNFRTRDGRTSSAATILDARRGIRARVATPRRLTVGDRGELSFRIENGYTHAVDVVVTPSWGEQLSIEDLSSKRQTRRTPVELTDGRHHVHLDPSEHVWLYAEFEAIKAGTSTVGATVRALDRAVDVHSTCVITRPEPAGKSLIQIERDVSLWTTTAHPAAVYLKDCEQRPALTRGAVRQQTQARWRKPRPNSPDDELIPADTDWLWAPVDPDTRLSVGQYLQVRERFTLAEPLPAGTWVQDITATCASVPANPREFEPIGLRLDDRSDRLSYHVDQLDPGTYEHTYLLAVVRPGACVMPPPEFHPGDETGPLPATVNAVTPIVIPAD